MRSGNIIINTKDNYSFINIPFDKQPFGLHDNYLYLLIYKEINRSTCQLYNFLKIKLRKEKYILYL